MSELSKITVAVVGLGYVGLPLAIEFGKKIRTIGFDLSKEKIESYQKFHDPTGEVESVEFRAAQYLEVTSAPEQLREADFIIIAVPTPVNETHSPDLSALVGSSVSVGKHMKPGVVVVYESTVYPGATEEVCIPVLEKHSGMKWREGFHVGYSPERVNPGDKERTITKIVKVVSGDDEETLERVAALYEFVITAGVYRTSSIKVAEAAKVIENTQRDLNIALMNELSILFHMLDIDTLEVLKAAGTKWNFLPFRPGLVGGHCIGVDPYYLTHKADMIGFHPEVILAGRRVNDGMANYIAQQTVKRMIRSGGSINGAEVIVLGLTFKENCPDLRNSKVADLITELQEFGCKVKVHDPIADADDAFNEYGVTIVSWDELGAADAIVAAVSHQDYLSKSIDDILAKLKTNGVFVDVKSAYDVEAIVSRGFDLWRL